jgi:AraC-like DNA-binding protein
MEFVGLSDAAVPYKMVRRAPPYDHLLVCTGGVGRVFVKDRWEFCRAGDTYLSPAGVLSAFCAVPRRRFQFAFVFLGKSRPWHRHLPSISTSGKGNGHALSSAIEGLYREVGSGANPEVRLRWLGLIELYWQEIVESRGKVGRLTKLWEKVDQNLAHPWTVATLADKVGLGRAQLRRVALAETGATPIHHVTRMRMNRAATLLQSSQLKIEAIAEAVGYANPFAFSSAFRRCMGCAPSRYLR